MFWIICGLITAITVLAIFLPFLRHRSQPAAPTAAYDLRIYRDQLREVERDLDRGVIDPADAKRLRVEIGRKVLEADRLLGKATAAATSPAVLWPALGLAVVIGLTVWTYSKLGAPTLPDAPIAARIAAAEEHYANRPSQAEAVEQARASQPLPPAADPEYLELIERLRTAVAERPNDVTGLRLLAEHEARLGNSVAATAAQTQLVAVLGNKTSADDHARLAALMIESAGGLITPEAENHLAQSIRRDAKNGQARYLSGLLQIQNGRPDRAFPIWANLLVEGPENAPWIAPIRAVIMDLAWFAGEPGFELPPPAGATALPGPDADAISAAEDMTPEQRQQMIAGMVEGLQTRLETQGGPPEEWARLIGALGVMGRDSDAREVWTEAQTHFADTPEAKAVLDAAARQAGLLE